jgi:predicted CopG family antitoxin
MANGKKKASSATYNRKNVYLRPGDDKLLKEFTKDGGNASDLFSEALHRYIDMKRQRKSITVPKDLLTILEALAWRRESERGVAYTISDVVVDLLEKNRRELEQEAGNFLKVRRLVTAD